MVWLYSLGSLGYLDNWSVPDTVGVDMLRRIYSSDNAKHTSISLQIPQVNI